MTAITHQGVSTAGDSNTSSRTGVTRPTTTTDDVFVFDLYFETHTIGEVTAAVAFSNGTWTKEFWRDQLGNADTNARFSHARYRSKYAGEGATFDVTWNVAVGSVWNSMVVNAYRLVDTTTPIDTPATSAASASSSASAVAPTLTTVTGDALVVYGETDGNGRTVTGPTGTTPTFTERTDFANLQVADGTMATAGATGDKTGTLSSADWNTAGMSALRPATPGGGGAADKTPYNQDRQLVQWRGY